MSNAPAERADAANLPEGDVVRILLQQHARIRDLFTQVKASAGAHKQELFDELRHLLAVHETAGVRHRAGCLREGGHRPRGRRGG